MESNNNKISNDNKKKSFVCDISPSSHLLHVFFNNTNRFRITNSISFTVVSGKGEEGSFVEEKGGIGGCGDGARVD
ncbi:hypothetical protein MTR_8g007275 [Medicago truncatula]|uniref:Uncharacterized protein n=1 Tax=Medicago truncatula TaxID=3880 RepID=A0A072TM50_MEDTR|nr:hypothetical protein MTR_8g007275 [Medicago truncatula]